MNQLINQNAMISLKILETYSIGSLKEESYSTQVSRLSMNWYKKDRLKSQDATRDGVKSKTDNL